MLFGVSGLARDVFVVESALPVVSQVPVLAGAYGADEEYAAAGACLSVLVCLVTVPFLCWVWDEEWTQDQFGTKLVGTEFEKWVE